jgi:hypothetical protein
MTIPAMVRASTLLALTVEPARVLRRPPARVMTVVLQTC